MSVNKREFFARFLFYSLTIHIFVFGYFILDPFNNWFPKKDIKIKNAIRVDTIGLPELKQKVEISKSSKKPAPKKPTPKKIVHKKQVKKKPKKPTPKVKVKKEQKKPEKINIKEKQNQAMDKIQKMKSIQEQQSQAMDKLEAMESLKQIKQEMEEKQYTGSALSKGDSPEGEVVTDFETVQYFTSVKAHINMYWSLPQELADKNLRTKIRTIINNEGIVLRGNIVESSGNEDFDARALEVLERASPLPKPPTKKIEKLLSKGVMLNFP